MDKSTKKEVKKELEEKAISIKGKSYSLVSDRVLAFHKLYPNGSIHTRIVSDNGEELIYEAKVTPDHDKPERYFTGYASGVRGGMGVDETAAVENGETSAVGRALGLAGIGILESRSGIASADEMNKSMNMSKPVSDKQKTFIEKLAKEKGLDLPDFEKLSSGRASAWINKALKEDSAGVKEMDRLADEEVNPDDIPF